MLATAIALQDATKNAVFEPETMELAKNLAESKDTMTDREFLKALFAYSAHLTAVTATLVTSTLLTESQMDEMMDSIKEIEALEKDITDGN